MRHAPLFAAMTLALGIFIADPQNALADPDCAKAEAGKIALQSYEYAFCADKRYDALGARLDAIEQQMLNRIAAEEQVDPVASNSRASAFRTAIASWHSFASDQCRALNQTAGANYWPEIHTRNCMSALVADRIKQLCAEPPEADYAGTACETSK